MMPVNKLALITTSAIFAAVSIAAGAGPMSKSPFATKKPKAWEQAEPTPAPPSSGQYSPPSTYTAPQYFPHQIEAPAPQYQPPQSYSAPQSYTAPQTNDSQVRFSKGHATYIPSSANTRQSGGESLAGGYYPGKQPSSQYTGSQYSGQNRLPQNQYAKNSGYQKAANNQGQHSAGQVSYNSQGLRGASTPTWANRLGLGDLKTNLSGRAIVGAAAVDRSGADVKGEVVADLDLRGEASLMTQGGLEYGAGVRVRAQRDRRRRGFGGRVGDCPAGVADCSSVVVNGAARSVKGHTSQFYTGGPADTKDAQLGLEGAYLFLRSAYGDVVLGRDDGAAYLFSIGAPSLVAVNASNSSVDYTGFDSVKTFNDASGFAEKLSYTTPRLLGDTVGVGVQLGVSYSPNAKACGVNYCVKDNGALPTDPFAPVMKNIIEGGLSLDRKFGNGLSTELTATYAHGFEDTGNAAFTDLSSYGAGLEVKYSNFVFGTSYLKSNNGFAGQGDYIAYDAGLTWKPNNWGFTASYGHADDDVAKLTSDQGVLAVSYDFGRFRLGSGVQYVTRSVPEISLGGRTQRKEDAAALFVEAGVRF